MEMVINLLQFILARPTTFDTSVDPAPEQPQRLLYLCARIRLRRAGHNARYRQELIRIQRLEQIDCLLKIVDDFLLGLVVDVAFGI